MEYDAEIGKRILDMDPKELRIRFFRPDEVVKIYRMSRGRVLDAVLMCCVCVCAGKIQK